MNILLQEHRAKHIYRVPDGLRELCTDISREVLRTQPQDIYCFIADYVDALLITRENAKIAMKVVRNIMIDSESIIGVLQKTGLSFEQIAAAAPRLQKSFRAYLDAVDIKPDQKERYANLETKSEISIGNILRKTGASLYDAERAATLIQAAFRGHYQRMLEREKRGEIQWQRAVANTMEILRKAGISQNEATKTATLIQSAYRGYYTRRNIKMKIQEDEDKKEASYFEPRETIQAVAWLDMMFEDSGLTMEEANEAASIIQKAYRKYRSVKKLKKSPKIVASRSLIVEAILDNLNQRVFNSILERGDFPKELGSQEKISESIEKVQSAYKEHLRKSQYSEGEVESEEEEEDIIDSEKKDFGESVEQREKDKAKEMLEDATIEEAEDQKVGEEVKEDREKVEDQEKQEDREKQEDQEKHEDHGKFEGQEKLEVQEKVEDQEKLENQEKLDDQEKIEVQEKQDDQEKDENTKNIDNNIELIEKENIDHDDHVDHVGDNQE